MINKTRLLNLNGSHYKTLVHKGLILRSVQNGEGSFIKSLKQLPLKKMSIVEKTAIAILHIDHVPYGNSLMYKQTGIVALLYKRYSSSGLLLYSHPITIQGQYPHMHYSDQSNTPSLWRTSGKKPCGCSNTGQFTKKSLRCIGYSNLCSSFVDVVDTALSSVHAFLSRVVSTVW